ncbi:hypothetical protein LCGC14_2701940, partial [marine sediment metagenome]
LVMPTLTKTFPQKIRCIVTDLLQAALRLGKVIVQHMSGTKEVRDD